MPLNFTANNWQLTIGNDNWDITNLVLQLVIRRPRAEVNTPYKWSGSLTLATPINPTLLTESLDDLVNPARWSPGLHPIRLRIRSTLVATLRIQRYFYDEDSRQGNAELTDQLGLRDYETPARDFEGLGFKVGNTACADVINLALQKAGLSGGVSLPGNFEVPPNKFNESYINFAQAIAGERGFWLYCSPNEVINSVSYFQEFLFSRSRSQIQDFERQSGLEIPAQLIRVTGSCEKIATCQKNYPEISEEFATVGNSKSKALQRRETINLIAAGNRNQQVRTIQVEQALGVAMPDEYPDSTTVVTTEFTRETTVYGQDGRLIKLETDTDRLLGIALPAEHPGSRIMVESAEKTTEEYFNQPTSTVSGDDGVLRCKKRTVRSLYPAGGVEGQEGIVIFGSQFRRAISEQTTETWLEGKKGQLSFVDERPPCQRYEYKRILYQREESTIETANEGSSGEFQYYQLGKLQLKSTTRKFDQPPPAWPTREPDSPLGTIALLGERRFAPATFSPYYEKEFEISSNILTSNAEAANLASLIGHLQHQRYRSRYITMPIPDEWLVNPSPFTQCNVHNGRFIIDSPAIAIEKKGEFFSLTFSFIGNYLGAIPEVPDIWPETPANPTSPIIEIISIVTEYNYGVTIEIDDVFENNSLLIIEANYDYTAIGLSGSIIAEYSYSVLLEELPLFLQTNYNFDVFLSVDNSLIVDCSYDPKVDNPMGISCSS